MSRKGDRFTESINQSSGSGKGVPKSGTDTIHFLVPKIASSPLGGRTVKRSYNDVRTLLRTSGGKCRSQTMMTGKRRTGRTACG